ncbi:transposable element Tcb2 transposase [Trichonephila clavipes]|nr:transposable element Tcb2 transposase [Trichonephila clavipes]
MDRGGMKRGFLVCFGAANENPNSDFRNSRIFTLLYHPLAVGDDSLPDSKLVVAENGRGNRLQETGNVRRRPGAGRPRATTSTDDRYIQLTARRNRTENATQLQRQLLLATGRKVPSQTVRNWLHEGGIYARRPMVCIPLTPRPRAARRRWAAEHRDWEQHD